MLDSCQMSDKEKGMTLCKIVALQVSKTVLQALTRMNRQVQLHVKDTFVTLVY